MSTHWCIARFCYYLIFGALSAQRGTPNPCDSQEESQADEYVVQREFAMSPPEWSSVQSSGQTRYVWVERLRSAKVGPTDAEKAAEESAEAIRGCLGGKEARRGRRRAHRQQETIATAIEAVSVEERMQHLPICPSSATRARECLTRCPPPQLLRWCEPLTDLWRRERKRESGPGASSSMLRHTCARLDNGGGRR